MLAYSGEIQTLVLIIIIYTMYIGTVYLNNKHNLSNY
jgi:hypothetical protein